MSAATTKAVAEGATPAWTIGSLLKWAADDFRDKGIEQPRLDAEVLLAFALSATRVELITDAHRPLLPSELGRFRELVKRRRRKEPVAYLVGSREFYGRLFSVDARVLVPRPDTETLVDVALARTAARSLSLRALDLCTGSGCVAVTVARERPTSKLHATDVDAGALSVARRNATRLGAYNVSFSRGDLFAGVEMPYGPFDLITANPPYIATPELAGLPPDVRDFEPRVALDGGVDGLALIGRVVEEAPRFLQRGGVLALEVGAGQAAAVARLLVLGGFEDVVSTRDYGKIERVVHGLRR